MAALLIVGAGAWGTALAIAYARAGHAVTLWARDPAPLLARRESPRLPGFPLPPGVTVTGTMPAAADLALLVTPVAHLRGVLEAALPPCPLVLCMKGLDPGSHLLPAEIAAAIRPQAPAAILTGPNFAHEVAAGLPAAAVLACRDDGTRAGIMALLGTATYRIYGTADLVGAQVGGAAKNVIAIAAGAAIGLGLGENARAAVVTRGLAEMARLAVALGGERETVAGLSGAGDLLLTCTGLASRNYRFGLHLGRGLSVAQAQAEVAGTIEGIGAAAGLYARGASVDRPLVAAVRDLAAGTTGVRAAVTALLSRPQREEAG